METNLDPSFLQTVATEDEKQPPSEKPRRGRPPSSRARAKRDPPNEPASVTVGNPSVEIARNVPVFAGSDPPVHSDMKSTMDRLAQLQLEAKAEENSQHKKPAKEKERRHKHEEKKNDGESAEARAVRLRFRLLRHYNSEIFGEFIREHSIVYSSRDLQRMSEEELERALMEVKNVLAARTTLDISTTGVFTFIAMLEAVARRVYPVPGLTNKLARDRHFCEALEEIMLDLDLESLADPRLRLAIITLFTATECHEKYVQGQSDSAAPAVDPQTNDIHAMYERMTRGQSLPQTRPPEMSRPDMSPPRLDEEGLEIKE